MTSPPERGLLGFLVRSVGTAEAAVFLELQLLRRILLVLGGGVVPLLARSAGESDDVSHGVFPFKKVAGAIRKPPL
jgi:hypothetical protein